MTANRLPARKPSDKLENRILPFSEAQAEWAAIASSAVREVPVGIHEKAMESWLALTNAVTWLDLAEAEKHSN